MSDSDPNSKAPPRLGPVVELSGVWDVSAAQLFIEPYCRALVGTAAPAATVESLLEVALRDYRERLLRDLLLTDIECAYHRAGDGAAVADLRTGYEERFPADLTVVDDCFRSALVADLAGLDWVEPTVDYVPPTPPVAVPSKIDDFDFLPGYDLRLISSPSDASDIPTEGKSLVIVASANQVLHIRIFDGDGKKVVDTDEQRLAVPAQQIEQLKMELEGFWPPHALSEIETAQVIAGVTSTVGHSAPPKKQGGGKFGDVYMAVQRSLGRKVALKTSPGRRPDDNLLSRFEEAKFAAASDDDSYIVQVFDVFSDGGVPYLVMKYYEGGTLHDRIKRSTMNGVEAADMLRKVAEGVAAVHKKGVIHCDIKPSNILMTLNGEPRVSDFGIVIRSDRGAQEAGDRCVSGTPGYMSPEQANGHVLTAAADVYALGATLYYCLTGDTPYQGRGEEIVPVGEVVVAKGGRLDPTLEAICMKCLEVDPASRYSDAAQLAEELTCYRNNRPTQVRPGGFALYLKRARAILSLDDPLQRFMALTTFTFGWGGGVLFGALYAVELVLLLLSPVAVRAPTYLNYALYDTIGPAADWSAVAVLDLTDWLTDFNKLIGYSLACFWFGLFARTVVARAPDDEPFPQLLGDGMQLGRFKEVVRDKKRPAWYYAATCALAVAATVTLTPGTVGLSHKLSLLNPASWGAPWRLPSHWPERLLYPALMFVWCLHFMTGLPYLFAHLSRNGLWPTYVRRLFAFLVPWMVILVLISIFIADPNWVGRRFVQILAVLGTAAVVSLRTWAGLPEDRMQSRRHGVGHYFPLQTVLSLFLPCVPLFLAVYAEFRGPGRGPGRANVEHYLKRLRDFRYGLGGHLQVNLVRKDREYRESLSGPSPPWKVVIDIPTGGRVSLNDIARMPKEGTDERFDREGPRNRTHDDRKSAAHRTRWNRASSQVRCFFSAADTVGEFPPWVVSPEAGQDEACWRGESGVSGRPSRIRQQYRLLREGRVLRRRGLRGGAGRGRKEPTKHKSRFPDSGCPLLTVIDPGTCRETLACSDSCGKVASDSCQIDSRAGRPWRPSVRLSRRERLGEMTRYTAGWRRDSER